MKQNKNLISDNELDKVVGGNPRHPSFEEFQEAWEAYKNQKSWYGTSKCPGPEACDVHKCNGCKDRGFSLISGTYTCGHK
ncbi:MAG: hypothetical protein ACERKN_16085 [Velocimicrobium sp.]